MYSTIVHIFCEAWHCANRLKGARRAHNVFFSSQYQIEYYTKRRQEVSKWASEWHTAQQNQAKHWKMLIHHKSIESCICAVIGTETEFHVARNKCGAVSQRTKYINHILILWQFLNSNGDPQCTNRAKNKIVCTEFEKGTNVVSCLFSEEYAFQWKRTESECIIIIQP